MPNEFGFPGLPVLSDEERLRRNKMQSEWGGLRNTGTTVADVPPSLQELQALADESGPSADELLNAAKQTLADTAGTQGELNLAAQRSQGRMPASAEAMAPRPTTTYRDVADQTLGAGSFLPGPVGLASRLGTGALGAYDLATEGPSFGNVLQTTVPLAFDALPAMRGLRAATPGPIRPQPGMHWTARQPAETAYRAAGDLPDGVSRIAPQLSDDVAEQVGRGFNPKAAIRGRRQSPMSDYESVSENVTQRGMGSLEGLQNAAETGGDDLTAALNALGEAPLSPEAVASARGAERFGRTFRSEGGAPARSVPSMGALQQEGLPPELVSALDALQAADESSMRSVLFGGVGARSGGELVRPSARSPISKARLSRSRQK